MKVYIMSDDKKRTLINILIAVFIGGGFFLGVFALFLLSPGQDAVDSSYPIIQIIAKPTPSSTPLPTQVPGEDDISNGVDNVDEIRIGSVVQIFNTGGAGLRLRSNPGTSSSVQFIGAELEPFSVVNGPTEQDGYVWWYLESPYDPSRSGWAAADYLQLIQESD
jgi:hypothetical protein